MFINYGLQNWGTTSFVLRHVAVLGVGYYIYMEPSRGKGRERKLSTWNANYLSIGGRVTLIKSILLNLPVYYFSIFRCSISIIKRLEKLQREFLWHGTRSQKKLHFVDWDSICKLKEGGLGIRLLKKMNQALLGKWLWRIGDGSQGLWR